MTEGERKREGERGEVRERRVRGISNRGREEGRERQKCRGREDNAGTNGTEKQEREADGGMRK